MNQFHVGQKVRVRRDIPVGTRCSNCPLEFEEGSKEHSGQTLTIKRFDIDGDPRFFEFIDNECGLHGEPHFFSPDWLEPVEEPVVDRDSILEAYESLKRRVIVDFNENALGIWTKTLVPYRPNHSLITRMKAIAKRLLDADTKALIEAGYIDDSLNLTQDGREALDAILFGANKPALVEQAKKEIEEKKED